ncbi:hypothetical protein ADK91_32830 [Streptomyces sp. XY511]|uniref:hypothetical protein n=1 Tax=Streptomyces sp. XY511 TaxID=1519480 RepID=UPI0006AE0E77|nr:hypothetical protein [Streptomyces sp. XY511]KOU97418.1 hypothetical protein ADK91_32830 [Streptomyces sp. XY511]
MAAKKTSAEPTACTCSQYEADGQTTGCTATTARVFAPGHDAKLKGFLIRAGAAGVEVTRTDAAGHRTATSAEDAASPFIFANMVVAGIKRAQDKAVAKAARQAARAAKKVAAKVEPAVEVTAKVGRWNRVGTVQGDTFTYTDAKGATKTTTKFRVIDEDGTCPDCGGDLDEDEQGVRCPQGCDQV